MALIVGQQQPFSGNVTTLNWIGARPARDIEINLGYGAGRLAKGYCVVLLKERLAPADFEFEGTTMRSGGRVGLPLASHDADAQRRRIHDQMISEYGEARYRAMQQQALVSAQLSGPNRIAKVIPMASHDPRLTPDVQYPMGGGGLQWKILPPGKRFLVALYVDESGYGHTLHNSVDLKPGAPYENRARIMQYLQTA